MHCFIIAEIGVNHNGSIDLAKELIDVASEAGSDAVKFQTFVADELARSGAPKADYQNRQNDDVDQLSMLRKLELSRDDHFELKRHSAARNIEFLSSIFSESAVDLLNEVDVAKIKIPSGEIVNRRLLEKIAHTARPLILSTGMSNLVEIETATSWICEIWNQCGFGDDQVKNMLTLLHCTSNYPTADADVNLLAMETMRGLGFPVGFSDHTADILIAPCAVAMGAVMIEKHITLDRTMPGPDHAASLEPSELKSMIDNIRRMERARGDGVKAMCNNEGPVRDIARKSVTLVRDVAEGEVVKACDLELLRPGTGIPPFELADVIGTRAVRALTAPMTLTWDDIADGHQSSTDRE